MGNDELIDIRIRAQDASNVEGMAGLLAMETELRSDTEWWPVIWAPLCAVAARKQGDERGRAFLDEAIAGGFAQPELFGQDIPDTFGADKDWPALVAAMAANVPPPPIELLSWPVITPVAPLSLFRLPAGRESQLRDRLPEPGPDAWDTALNLLGWVTTRWRHANDHETSDDAVKILERVDEGARFACVEYSTVLSQALNAVGIPARRVSLCLNDYHTGIGRGHVVSEAWIGTVGKWVVLDGQNGMYWHDEAGTPLSLPELLDLTERPEHRYAAAEISDSDAKEWWAYFTKASNGTAWGSPGFVPVFQGRTMRADELLANRALAYPDLSELAIGIADGDGKPVVTLRAAHPFATGFEAGGEPVTQWTFPDVPAGEHEVALSVVTAYGPLRSHVLRYRTA